jgi:two-component system response regulator GlrR
MARQGKASLLLVDDDPDLLRLLSIRLKANGYEVTAMDSGQRALASIAANRPDLVLTDLRMDGMDGMALFQEIQASYPGLPVIILTAHGTIPDAVAATQSGVFGYLTKPYDAEELLAQIERALSLHGGGATKTAASGQVWREDIITRSSLMEDLLAKAQRVAAGDASVLIQGESGTGKELLARAIHRASVRANQPFVAINCGAIPETLLESELFGHMKGSFTGAIADQRGLFVAADKGTLFLDEIGDMPLTLQVKLLRVIETREVRPIGATRSTPFDVRIISATHRDLAREKLAGTFREDLYYRLNVVNLKLPSLEERPEDIPLLAEAFLKKLAPRYGRDKASFSPEALELLGEGEMAGQRAPALQRRRAIDRALSHGSHATGLRRACDPGGDARDDFVRGCAQALRARLPHAHPQDHQGQRHPGGKARTPQSHRVLQAPAAPRNRGGALQGRRAPGSEIACSCASTACSCRSTTTRFSLTGQRLGAGTARGVAILRRPSLRRFGSQAISL